MWYSRETAPEPGNRFRLRLRCVRACVRAKLRVRDDSAVARVGQINLSVVRPAPAVPRHFLCFWPGSLSGCSTKLN